MNFILGSNYWASHVGTNMWKQWDLQTVENDLSTLSRYGISYLRVFPIWSDFQPIKILYGGAGSRAEIRFENDMPLDNPYGLDDTMLCRFEMLCEIAQRHHIRLIVGLITGWMSGRLYVPQALSGLNIHSDPTALMWQQKFVKGFVSRMKPQKAIYAWDLGNECNCMAETTTREQAYHWTAVVANAIRANDAERPIVSGMHSLLPRGVWTIQDQAENTDILTTHPYPYFTPHCGTEKINSIKSLFHATAENKMYSTIGGKPSLVEEIGTLGPMNCSDEVAADYLRLNLFSNWANGAAGVMWWCAHDQNELNHPPYDWNMCERELGMLKKDAVPKPILLEMKKFAELIATLGIQLPSAQYDAVCLLTKDQDCWGVAYSTYILAKQASLNVRFTYCDQPLPDSPIYLLPSIKGLSVMDKRKYVELKEKVCNGAKLYISMDNGFLTEFEELTGLQIITSEQDDSIHNLQNLNLPVLKTRQFHVICRGAEAVDADENGVAYAKNRFGKGMVYTATFPLESFLCDQKKAFDQDYYKIYSEFAGEPYAQAVSNSKYVCITRHREGKNLFLVAINYSDGVIENPITVSGEYEMLYGDIKRLNACDGMIIKIVSPE